MEIIEQGKDQIRIQQGDTVITLYQQPEGGLCIYACNPVEHGEDEVVELVVDGYPFATEVIVRTGK